MRGADKNNVIANVKETIRRIEEQTKLDSTGNAWMIPLQDDLHLLLKDSDKNSGEELDQKLRQVLKKHQPAS